MEYDFIISITRNPIKNHRLVIKPITDLTISTLRSQ